MPYLLAEILNFQGSTHLIGVGSLSKIVKIAEFCQRFLTEFEPVLTEMFGKTPDWYHYDE